MNSGKDLSEPVGAVARPTGKNTVPLTGRQETAMGKTNNKVPAFGRRSVLAEFARLFRSIVDPYRPELHYMRGPGPKWHAKHTAAPTEAPAIHGLAHIKH
jgi:hypothetical protein